MDQNTFEESYCGECEQPLFLNKQECLDWIENKLKQGYIVCQCCGAKHALDTQT